MVKIKVQGIRKNFFRKGIQTEAIKGLSLNVNEKEFVTIIGPSGCGKTTFLRILAGLIPYDAGSIFVDGKPVEGPGFDRAMVFQQFNLYPWRNILDNVSIGLELRGYPKNKRYEIAQKYIKLVGLTGFEKHYPQEMSGGMQQRAGLARALAVNPDILLMDEPFASVDAQTRETLQTETLKIWSETQKTVVFITHSIDEAVYLSDRIILLTPRPGKVAEIFDVDLPRPRWSYDTHAHPVFVNLRSKISNILKQSQP